MAGEERVAVLEATSRGSSPKTAVCIFVQNARVIALVPSSSLPFHALFPSFSLFSSSSSLPHSLFWGVQVRSGVRIKRLRHDDN